MHRTSHRHLSSFVVTLCCCLAGACRSAPESHAPYSALAAVSSAEPSPFVLPAGRAGATTRLLGDPTLAVWEPAGGSSALVVGPARAAASEQYPNLAQTFGLNLGIGTYSNFDTSIRVDSDVVVGAVVDLEETLGVDQSSSVGRLDGFYRFNPRHQVDFSLYDISRGGVRGIANDIQIGEVLLPGGSAIDTKFDTTIFKLDYRYNFVSDERTRIGASFGLHTMRFDTAFATVNGTLEEQFKADLPLPLIGLHFEYALSRKWKLASSLEVLQMDLGPYSGLISDRRLTVEHDTFDNFGWGVGYNGFTLDAKFEGDNGLSSEANMEYQGLLLYLRWYF